MEKMTLRCSWNGHGLDGIQTVKVENGLTVDTVCQPHLSQFSKAVNRLAENGQSRSTQLKTYGS